MEEKREKKSKKWEKEGDSKESRGEEKVKEVVPEPPSFSSGPLSNHKPLG
jgi:hypothetical protein